MDNDEHGLRATGEYAKFNGRIYFAHRVQDSIWLHSDDDPLPPGFEPSSMDWIRGERFVPMADIEGLSTARTTCTWRGHPFEVGIIEGDSANVTYLGKDFDAVGGLPGLWRPDKYEVIGMVPVSELTDVEQITDEVPLGDRSANGNQ
ncbi:hypothetical protein [Mycolicibacterium sp. P9-64]|uniref:hypothetical protein n=1 Tax=Mycolicibacterium sp. P9-64 TaxID=2024612 RepID=UPI0011EC959E|nr:hypothetical protein [Mycolicibacterium sp. P9-64]